MKRRGREESKEILGLESNEERKAERWVVMCVHEGDSVASMGKKFG